ncbi:MAG TPA: thiamine-phosphate kinase, partial [Rhodobacteraceae bacterium]|nr:thiamine-phosphate kinase [Paracoccaceae bacterium]
VSTDAVREGVHFFFDDAPADIASKALAVNVSDIVAKGARPLSYVMALSFRELPDQGWLTDFAAGLKEAQEKFGLHLAGGDLDRAPGPLSIVITIFGEVPTGTMVTRAGAQAGDGLFVSGVLGQSAFGLRLRRDRDLAGVWGLCRDDAQELVQRYLRPDPPHALAPLIRTYARAAMDLSDGLIKDLGRLCATSGVGAVVTMDDVPVSDAVAGVLARKPHMRDLVVTGGDDYQVLLAVPADRETDFTEAAAAQGSHVSRIGRITADVGVRLTDSDGRQIVLSKTGWDHF